jgi:hypothetical protein
MCNLNGKSSEHVACALSHQLPTLPPACFSIQPAQVGDEILIASSSILPDDVDEAVVAAIEPLPSGNTRLVLDRALRYTHLGVVLAVEGEERVVDMRAEVAVLTRNVVVQASAQAAGNAAAAGQEPWS